MSQNKTYYDLLCKLRDELETFRKDLKAKGVETVYKNAYEITVREDILCLMEEADEEQEPTREECQVLCETPNLLTKLANEYLCLEPRDNAKKDVEINYRNEVLYDCLENIADKLINLSKKPRLYVDMDGTLAVFNNQIESEEVLFQKGYYLNLEPQQNVVDAVKKLTKKTNIEVFVLSAVLPSPYAEYEKREWLNVHLPEVHEDHRIFVPCGEDKGQYIGHALRKNDLLLDDYSKNLHAWCPPGNAIKLMNGINGHFGTWKGATISCFHHPDQIADKIEKKFLEIQKEKKELGKDGLQTTVVERYISRYNTVPGYINDLAILKETVGDKERFFCYDRYNEETMTGAARTGPFLTLEDAEQDLIAHHPDVKSRIKDDKTLSKEEAASVRAMIVERIKEYYKEEGLEGLKEIDENSSRFDLAFSCVAGPDETAVDVQVTADLAANAILFNFENGTDGAISFSNAKGLLMALSMASFDSLIGDAQEMWNKRQNDKQLGKDSDPLKEPEMRAQLGSLWTPSKDSNEMDRG